VDRLCAEAPAEGRLRVGPDDLGYPVGYRAFIADPDGNNLEVSHGQEIALTLAQARPDP
jgi:lactoylglutathione lyase